MSPNKLADVFDAFVECADLTEDQKRAYLAELEAVDFPAAEEVRALLEADRTTSVWNFLDDPVPLPTRPLIGHRFDDYTILEFLGCGGMGQVYKARQESTAAVVAVKLMRTVATDTPSHEEATRRFREEISVLGRFAHDNIVSVLQAGSYEGQPYYAMQYVDGESLNQRMSDKALGTTQPMDAKSAARYMCEVARAVQYAHGQSVLHRDLKPQNILIEAKKDRAYVVDFGLAKDVSVKDASTTKTGAVMGTPNFMAPEQATGGRATVSTDIYGIGATLYFALTGRPPFQAENAVETQRQVVDGELVPPWKLNPSVPRDVESICLKCLEKLPHHRYASAEHAADDLQRFLDNRPTKARPIGPLRRLWRWSCRQPGVAGLTAMLFLILTATTVASIVVARERMKLLNGQTVATQQAEANFVLADDVLSDLQKYAERPNVDIELKRELLGRIEVYLRAMERQAHDASNFQVRQAETILRRARIVRETNSVRVAIPIFEEAIGVSRALADDVAADAKVIRNLAGTYQELSQAYLAVGDSENSLANQQSALLLFQQLLEVEPENERYISDLNKLRIDMGVSLVDLKQFEQAERQCKAAITAFDGLIDASPDWLVYRGDRAKASMILADVYRITNQWDLALAKMEQAERELIGLVEKEPGNAQYASDLGLIHSNLAATAKVNGDNQEAERHLALAIQLFENLVGNHPKMLAYRRSLAICYGQRAIVYRRTGEPEKAIEQLRRIVKLYDGADVSLGEDKDSSDLLFYARSTLADDYWKYSDHYKAVEQAVLAANENLVPDASYFAARQCALAGNATSVEESRGRNESPLTKSYYSAVVDYLVRAENAGYFTVEQNRMKLQNEPAFAPIRQLSRYRALLERLNLE